VRIGLVLHTLKVLNLDGITIDSLIAFRKRERSEANGKMYTDLRHRYSERLSSYVDKLARATDGAARSTLQSEFEEDMRFDFHTLKQELRVVRSDAVFPAYRATRAHAHAIRGSDRSVGSSAATSNCTTPFSCRDSRFMEA
jgi:hypothetical protein